ncbi:dynamin family protein [Deinococcus roseus]|uniref:G domain-containing protein n=1 Tax=Deinococcus roseus TaxID=392414 RepID=A0ABQ2CW19_9DEIO|nr:dynamin family protein [Deinococcus roseus]GGJ26434.1 hypothetical protein GCM10008938_10790 [Deinococcus roseus]
MLVTPSIQEILQAERALLTDLHAFLESSGAPADVTQHARTALLQLDEVFLLVVVGEFNAGKSSFLNALLNTTSLPEGVTPTTDRIYVLLNGEDTELEPTADPFVVRKRLPLEDLNSIALVDTPGTNAVIRRHQTITEGFLPRADLVLFITSADHPFTESERQFLELTRKWGRNVMLIINKADLLETQADREQVLSFVREHATQTLGVTPQIFMLSARNQKRGEDEGFMRFKRTLVDRLSEKERVRLKLMTPLGVAHELVRQHTSHLEHSRTILQNDVQSFEHLEMQARVHGHEVKDELAHQLSLLEGPLNAFQERAESFINRYYRISRTLELLKPERLEQAFRTEAVADLERDLEKVLSHSVDRLMEKNLRFWEDVQHQLTSRSRENVPRSRFQMDRSAVLDALRSKTEEHTRELIEPSAAQDFSGKAQSSVMQAGLISVGGIGLGAAVIALIGGAAADVTGILASLAGVFLGAYWIPIRKRAALTQVKNQVGDAKILLRETLTREVNLEQERLDGRLRDALSPYTRFVKAEQERMNRENRRLTEFIARIEELEGRVQA